MTRCIACLTPVAALVAVLASRTAAAQLAPPCAENSPERRGGIGCSIIQSKLLPDSVGAELYWHIDRFGSLQAARAAAGPDGVAVEASGGHWLMTVEPRPSHHHGGRHVTLVGPLPLPPAARYTMQVFSAAFRPGMYSLVHQHSGAEAWYMLEGEQCLETPKRAATVRQGETLVVPAGVPMRLVATGTTVRRALAVIVHDAAQPPTTRMSEGAGPPLVACRG